MTAIIEAKTEKYLNDILPRRDAVVAEMERYAAKYHVPIVGPACGRMLYQLARAAGARRIFEMGSAIGYSTLWLARAVGPKGVVYYTDGDPANAECARAYLRRAGVLGQVRILIGDALDLLKSTQGQFDLIFNDVHKLQYPEVFRLVMPRLRAGGLLYRTMCFGRERQRGLPLKRTLRRAPSRNSIGSSIARRDCSRLLFRCATGWQFA